VTIEQMWERASRHAGCLADQATVTGRRKIRLSRREPLQMSSDFRSDEARLWSSKAFRVLQLKTQVLTAPNNPFIRTRQSHVLEVVADSVVVADILGLNTELVRAIAIGHDIGHVPFGHPGEHFLAEAMGRPFCHEVMGPLVAQKIERKGEGLNLTWQTLDGMMRHSGNTAREDMTQEAWLVRWMDKVAYLFADYHDITDRMCYPVPPGLISLMNEFGSNHSDRTSTAMAALIIESAECGRVSFDHSPWAMKFKELRSAMMEIYPRLTQQNFRRQMEPVLEFLQSLNIGNPFLLFALLTDQDVIKLAKKPTLDVTHLKETAIGERLEFLATLKDLDLCNPHLDW
jgi:dGTPase